MKIAGLDIGTTGCKCTVFDEQGTFLGKAYRDYPVRRTVGGHEIDITVVMDGVYATIREMAEQYSDIAGIGVTSFGETFVCVNEAGEPLHPAMLYTDPRGHEECTELTHKLGAKRIASVTGLRPHEMYSISKIMWLRRHHPEIWNATKRILLMEDYVVYHLTGKAQIDYSLASRTMAFDIRNLSWSREIFDAAQIDPELMSEPVPSGTIAGNITTEAMHYTGLLKTTKVVSVSHDQVAAAVGAGVFDGSVAVDGAGTVECLTPVFDSLPDTDAMYDGYYAVVPYVIPGKYVAYAFSYTGGALIQWCTQELCKNESREAASKKISVNEYMERSYAAKGEAPSDLLVLPHFAGAATPYMDTGSKGVILGLTTASTTADLYHACMEGVVYEMALNAELLRKSGTTYTKMRATGGGARSAVWMQMKADILQVPVTALRTMDAGTVGSAMLTGVALGVFRNPEDAAEQMVAETETYLPRPHMYEQYRKKYDIYRNLYEAVRPLMRLREEKT